MTELDTLRAAIEVVDAPTHAPSDAAARLHAHLAAVQRTSAPGLHRPTLVLVTADAAVARAHADGLASGAGVLGKLLRDAAMLPLLVGVGGGVADGPGWPDDAVLLADHRGGVALVMALAQDADPPTVLALVALDDHPMTAAVVAGVVLGAAAVRVAVVIDGAYTTVGATQAVADAPAIAGYIVAADARAQGALPVAVLLSVAVGGADAPAASAALAIALTRAAMATANSTVPHG